MSFLKDIPELVKAGVITSQTAHNIQEYYNRKGSPKTNRLLVVFSILGAILVGLGSILIIAHNWDQLSRGTKIGLAFVPLLVGQVLCGFALTMKQKSMAWRESAATFLFLSIGASTALIAQLYNIPGSLSTFLLTWLLLGLPLLYVMKSNTASLLYLIGITCYTCDIGYVSQFPSAPYQYWALLLLAAPYYYLIYTKTLKSNFITFHNYLIPLSLVITLGVAMQKTEVLIPIAYCSLFGVLYILGDSPLFSQKSLRNNGFKVMGSLSTIILLLIFSFDRPWRSLRRKTLPFEELVTTPGFFVATFLSVLAAGLLYRHQENKPLHTIKPIAPVFMVFIFLFMLGLFSPLGVVGINLYILALGIATLIQGAKQNHLGILNYGLLIITALVTFRFFDTGLSFVSRGLLFVVVGVGFFAANTWMLKKRKQHE